MSLRKKLIGALVPVVLFAPAAMAAAESVGSPVSWTVLASAQEAAPLDRKVVAIKGFRVPLEERTHFLVASKPSDCPDHIEDGPQSYVEVFSKEPVKPTFGRPLTVTGKLQLLRNDPGGAVYRLVDAELVSVD